MGSKRDIRIGSRESRLAVIQSKLVSDYIEENCDDVNVSILTMKTTGDKILDRTLDEIGGKGLFVKELDRALMEGRSDISVHSLKDMPMDISEELPVVAFSVREDPRDVLVLPKGADQPDPSLPVGCSSKRRMLQYRAIYPDAVFKPVRGNVLTRLEKLDRGEYGCLILAAAGLKRLGLENRISRYFEPSEMIPSAGQGILAVQGRKDEDYSFLSGYDDEKSRVCAQAERAFVSFLDGGCSSPVAAFCSFSSPEEIELRGLYYSEGKDEYVTGAIKGSAFDAAKIAVELAEDLRKKLEERRGMQTGKVWLVGAGPGAAGLFTIKGEQVLSSADVVLYDSLVGDEVLGMIPETAEKIDVGKRASRHTMPQREISRMLAEEALKGRKVVRLKGGDPFLFGRGGEELEVLAEEHIPFEVVPGVSSPIAVAAYAGIPVTHRDMASSVHIITGHRREGEDYDIDFEALVKAGGTWVFLMGIGALHTICEKLMEAGLSENMPAAVIQQGTTAGQKLVSATVGSLEEQVLEQGIETPALIVVGEVCRLAGKLGWMNALPLSGKKILVTRPAEKDSYLASYLRRLGAEVLEIPAIRIAPIENNTSLTTSLENLDSYGWIVFTSPRGADIFFSQAMDMGIDGRRMQGKKFACIGQGTGQALRNHGILPDLIPDVYDGEHLGKALAEVCEEGAHILMPRSAIGGSRIIEEICKRPDLRVDDIPTYDTKPANPGVVDIKGLFESGKINMTAFTSASAVRAFVHAADGLDMSKVSAACIGRQTGSEAESAGMAVCISQEATMDSLIQRILEEIGH